MDHFLDAVAAAGQDPHRLAQAFSVHPANPHMLRIYSARCANIDQTVEARGFFSTNWLAFNEMCASFIRLSSQFNPYSSIESIDLYLRFMEDVQIAFSNQRGWILMELVKETVNFILPLVKRIDRGEEKPRLAHMASLLLKIFNNIRSQTNEENQQKTPIILFISNKLCLIYFNIANPLLCRNVFSNITTLNLTVANYPLVEVLGYRFYLGKFYLIKSQLIEAYQHLSWCLLHCPHVTNSHMINSRVTNNHVTGNTRKILQLLLPLSVVIGKTPNFGYLASVYGECEAVAVNRQLHAAIVSGDVWQLNACINQHAQYYRGLKVLVMVQNKSVILAIRNLFKRVWLILRRPTALKYDHLAAALRVARFHEFFKLDDLIVENLLVSLIDQNLLKGKIFPRLRVVSLAKTNVFPAVDQINFAKFGAGEEARLAPADRWLA